MATERRIEERAAELERQAPPPVTATSASDVWAVGQSGPHPVIVHFDGNTWTRF